MEDIADNPEILKSFQLFDLYMADFYNALKEGVVSNDTFNYYNTVLQVFFLVV